MSSRVEFSDQEIEDIIKQQITGPNKDLLSKAIIGLLDDTEWKKAILLKAALGTKAKPEFRLHEDHYIRYSDLSMYGADTEAMKEKKLIDHNSNITCKIIKFNPFLHSQYTVRYDIINEDGKKESKTYNTHKIYLTVVEEFPEEDPELPF